MSPGRAMAVQSLQLQQSTIRAGKITPIYSCEHDRHSEG